MHINRIFLKLIIDIGNTYSKVAIFDRKELVNKTIIKDITLSKVKSFILEQTIQSTIISSVVKQKNEHIEIIKFYDAILLDTSLDLPIKLKYKNPKTLGCDRIASLVAAFNIFPNQDVLIFDLGTCLTVDILDKNGTHLGGKISPGIHMRFNSLHHFTSHLPNIKISDKTPNLGVDTETSIISGVQQGLLDEIKSTIHFYLKENPKINVVITGGDSFFLQRELKNSIFVDQFFVLKGLNEILDYNESIK